MIKSFFSRECYKCTFIFLLLIYYVIALKNMNLAHADDMLNFLTNLSLGLWLYRIEIPVLVRSLKLGKKCGL